MTAVRYIIAAILFLAGIALALYLGLYVCLYGGIVQGINGVTSNPISATDIALGIVRVCCTGLVGWGTFFLTMSVASVFAD